MSSWVNFVMLLTAMVSTSWVMALPEGLEALGRPATEGEVSAWDIDVRPDFVGLPPGSGDVWAGEEIWLDQCASCHGDFGDSNEIFAPLVLGNITEEDIASGRVASLTDPAVTRTTLMKVPTLSTLWDYIHRAMPWSAPKTLSPDEVYALVAYLLNLGYVVDDDFVLSDTNMAETQARMPNRNGMSLDHGLWSVSGAPDVSGSSCTAGCDVAVTVTSSLPAYAMNAHGNLAEQVRDWGPYPGLWTETETGREAAAEPEQVAAASEGVEAVVAPEAALNAGGCSGCHQMAGQLVGPGFDAIRTKYAGQEHAAYLRDKIVNGGAGVWGSMPMPPMPAVEEDALQQIVAWLTSGEE
ncbi:MAG: c-type cytochrome [Luminiphilus sp.]